MKTKTALFSNKTHKAGRGKKSASKLASKPTIKVDMHTWNTSDADEIARRKVRAEMESFEIENSEPSIPYFSTYSLSTNKGKKYHVEIRSLTSSFNSCDCPDYCNNGLGTCKHIEHLLLRLQKKGVRAFKKAATAGSPMVEIFLNRINEPKIQVLWPSEVDPSVAKIIESFFSSDGSFIGNPVERFSVLENAVEGSSVNGRPKSIRLLSKLASANEVPGVDGAQRRSVPEVLDGASTGTTPQFAAEVEFRKKSIRISRHIAAFLEYQKINSEKQVAKQTFLKDVSLGKRSMNVVKYPLLPYQQEGMLHLAFTERALLADEMGLGKTVQAIAASDLLRQLKNIQRVLVVTTASLKAEWEEQIAKFTDLPSLPIFGTRPKRLKRYQENAFFYLMNYEQVISDHAEIQRILAPDLIILDEAQRIKNWQTKTAAAIKELKSRYAFVLTGTPIENRIDDIYSIVQFLDPHLFGPLFRFNRNFYVLGEDDKAAGYKNLDELYRRLRPIMLCRKKRDVEEELPERLNKNYFVSMSSEQQNRYAEYEDMVARLLHKVKRQGRLTKEDMERLQRWLACMRMLCDTPFILDKECTISPKLDELNLIVEELLGDASNKIIIFSEWERMLHLIQKSLTEKGYDLAWHTGSAPQKKRREEIQRFKNDPNCRLFLSTDSGSVGLNLQAANIVINCDLPWNPAKLEQRIARAWRKYQQRSVQVINLISENTIEHRMLYLLQQKQLLADGVLTGDGDLSEMKIPTGRAAFMERMNALMADNMRHEEPSSDQVHEKVHSHSHHDSLDQGESLKKNLSPQTEKLRTKVMTIVGDDVDIFHYQNRETTQPSSTVIVVCDDLEKLPHKELGALENIEAIDYKTMEAIQRLVNAGILSFNGPISALHNAEKSNKTPQNKKLSQQQIEQLKHYLALAERKQKMAYLLMEGDLLEEAVQPLREAVEMSLRAFSYFSNAHEEEPIDLSTPQIKETLLQELFVDQHELPREIIPLFSQLFENSVEQTDLSSLHAIHQKIIKNIQKKTNS